MNKQDAIAEKVSFEVKVVSLAGLSRSVMDELSATVESLIAQKAKEHNFLLASMKTIAPDGNEDPTIALVLTVRSVNILRAEKIDTIDKLCSYTVNELLRMPNMGRKSVNEIREVLAERGRTLRGEVLREAC